MTLNYYTVLGIAQTASQDEIRKMYLKMAKKYHPDKNNEGTEKFKEIGNAYKTLSCPQSRKDHDAELRSSKTSNGSCYSSRYRENFNSTDTSHSTKRQKTSQGGRYCPETPPPPSPPTPPPPRRPDYNIKATTKLTLNQSFTGLDQHYVHYTETIHCNVCKGVADGFKRVHKCAYCAGEGLTSTEIGGRYYKTACDICHGKGTVSIPSECTECKGKKYVHHGFHIPIGKGVHTHHVLKVKDHGNLMPDGVTRGDVLIEVIVDVESDDGSFKRRGDDLHLNLNISLRDAILDYGNKNLFKHLDNSPVYLNRTPGSVIKPGARRIIRGEGMPVFMSNTGAKGDLHVTFNVVFPDVVNVPESLDDRKIINDLFITEEEKRAKENAIIIDDDDDDKDDEDDDDDDDDEDDDDSNEDADQDNTTNSRSASPQAYANGRYELIDSGDEQI